MILLKDLFILNKQLSISQDIKWWTGGFLWLSFWRHPFTADNPLVSKWFNATFLQICSEEETNSSASLMTWGWVKSIYPKIL